MPAQPDNRKTAINTLKHVNTKYFLCILFLPYAIEGLGQPSFPSFVVLDIPKTFSASKIGHTQIEIFNIRIFPELFRGVIHDDSAVFHHIGMGSNIERQLGILLHQKYGYFVLLSQLLDDITDFMKTLSLTGSALRV